MSATLQMPSSTSKFIPTRRATVRRMQKPVWILGFIVLAGIAAWMTWARAAITSPTNATALEPGLRLATGTLKLEGTDQAIDSASAATLLPLWQLLQELSTSSTAAPQEITTVVNEIQLNMTAAQLKAIDAMSADQGQLTASNSAASAAAGKTSTGAASQPADMMGGPALGGMLGGAPMDAGGGPLPSVSAQSSTSAVSSSGTSAAPAAIQQVIQLLEKKAQG